MNYEKAYKEALSTARKLYNMRGDWTTLEIESIFPELRESEYERIRKEIVRFIQMEVEDEIVGNKWIAWLEKNWKPTEAQMKCLKEACDKHWEPDGLGPLYTLYEQLKAL